MIRLPRCGAVLIGLIVCSAASAADNPNPPPREAYRYTDDKGKVGYSDLTPPPSATTSKKVDLTPANSGTPGSATHSKQSRSASARKDPSQDGKQAAQEKVDEAKQKQLAEKQAKARCERYGGEGCPETLTRDAEPTVTWRTKPLPEPRPYR